MEARERSQIIASEWMIDSQNPVHSISRLKSGETLLRHHPMVAGGATQPDGTQLYPSDPR
jgi:hypothetical protein